MILKASDVAKVPEPMMEKHHKTPFCVDNQLIESKQEWVPRSKGLNELKRFDVIILLSAWSWKQELKYDLGLSSKKFKLMLTVSVLKENKFWNWSSLNPIFSVIFYTLYMSK